MQDKTFEDELWAQIRKDFGDHLMRYNQLKKARENFQESLQYQPDKLDSVYRLARCQTREAKADVALKNLKSRSRQENYDNHFSCNLQECDCYYELNDFEGSILVSNAEAAKCKTKIIDVPYCGPITLARLENSKSLGPKLSVLKKRFDTALTNIEDAIGKKAGECLWEQRKCFPIIFDRWRRIEKVIDYTPLVIKGRDPCHQLNNYNNSADEITIRKIHKAKQIKRRFTQNYMKSISEDYEFINELRNNEILKSSTQNANSFEAINYFINDCIQSTSVLIEQLHARCPMYTRKYQMFSNERHRKYVCMISQFRLSHRLCRAVFTAFREMVRWHEEGNLENLINVAEYEMGQRFRIYSDKMIPRKNEFTVRICNYISYVHLERLLKSYWKNSKSIKDLENASKDDLYKLLGRIFDVKLRSLEPLTQYEFGNQNTYQDPTEIESKGSFQTFIDKIARLEQRYKQKPMLAIEKCHLLYEMGRANSKQMLADAVRNFGRRVIEMAKDVSHLWSFLGYVMIVRGELKFRNFIRIHESIKEAAKHHHLLNIDALNELMSEVSEIAQVMRNKMK